MRGSKFWAIPAGLGMMAVGAITLGPTIASAHGNKPPADPAKAAEIKQCLADHGITTPPKGKPTADERAALDAARTACGLPTGPSGQAKPGPGAAAPQVDPAKAAEVEKCLADKGVTPPAKGDKTQLTPEARQALADALKACGVPAGGPFGPGGPGGHGGPLVPGGRGRGRGGNPGGANDTAPSAPAN
jgi:hypothetical protein